MKKKGFVREPSNLNEKDKVVISSEFFEDTTTPSYICSICNQTLIRLTDAGMNNVSFWCRHCSVEWNPEEENVRRESKLSVPNRNEETLVSNTPGIPDISIRKEPEIKGGLKALKDKGLKITNYKEDIPKKRSWKVGS